MVMLYYCGISTTSPSLLDTMSSKAYQQLHKQLLINTKAAVKKQNAAELKKDIALLSYHRINAIKAQDSSKAKEIEHKLAALKKQTENPVVTIDPKLIAGLKTSTDAPHSLDHITDIANYLSYHREYNVLIERYNPGLSMTQEDKIRKTARHVGFELPPDANH